MPTSVVKLLSTAEIVCNGNLQPGAQVRALLFERLQTRGQNPTLPKSGKDGAPGRFKLRSGIIVLVRFG